MGQPNDYADYLKTYFYQLKHFCETFEQIMLDDKKVDILIQNPTIQKLKNDFLLSNKEKNETLLCEVILNHFYNFPATKYNTVTYSQNSFNRRNSTEPNTILFHFMLDHYHNALFIELEHCDNEIEIEYQKDKEIDLSIPELNIDIKLQNNRTFNISILYYILFQMLNLSTN